MWKMSAATVVQAHGWRGAHNFTSASRALTDIDFDRAEEEIYMSIDPSCRDALLLVDWDADDVDIKLGVLAVPGAEAKAFDLSISNKAVKKKSDMYTTPRLKCDGAGAAAAFAVRWLHGAALPARRNPPSSHVARRLTHAPHPRRQVRLQPHSAAGRCALRQLPVRHQHLLLLGALPEARGGGVPLMLPLMCVWPTRRPPSSSHAAPAAILYPPLTSLSQVGNTRQVPLLSVIPIAPIKRA
jgi:hypothetical protein